MDICPKHSKLLVGDLVKVKRNPPMGRLAIVTDVSMAEFFETTSWIRIAYADSLGGFEWVHKEGIQKLNKTD